MDREETVICYLYHEGIKARDSLYLGQGIYRHPSKCCPGSARWLASSAGKKSDIKKFFEEDVHSLGAKKRKQGKKKGGGK